MMLRQAFFLTRFLGVVGSVTPLSAGVLMVVDQNISQVAWAAQTDEAREVTSTPYAYKIENADFEGILSRPAGAIKGAILIVHNWMGVTNETKKQAERFAELGFLALSADVYGKGVRPKGPEEAGKLASFYKQDRQLLRARLTAALSELEKQNEVTGKPVFAAGYCFGGTGVLELARAGLPLAAVMSFHGGLDSPTPADGGKIKSAVYAFHGADDPYVSSTDLTAFEKEMSTHKVDWQLVKFGGAVHSFTDESAGNDPSKGAAYHAKADARSFEMAKTILKNAKK